jgi:hypothetical protein
MYGWGYAQISRRVTGDPESDAVLIVDDGIGTSGPAGSYAVRQFNMNTPIARRFYPVSVGVPTADDSGLIENVTTLPAAIPPVQYPTPGPSSVPVAVASDSGLPWWMWGLGIGAGFLLFKGGK